MRGRRLALAWCSAVLTALAAHRHQRNFVPVKASFDACERRGFLLGALSAVSLATGAPVEAAAPTGTGTVDVLPPVAAAFSGAVQGISQNVVKQLILHPFDTVKTRLQAQAVASGIDIDRRDLFKDVYRGLLPTLVSGTPGSASFFAAKEAAQSVLQTFPQPVKTSCGVLAGVLCAKAIKTPFDVAETKAMASVAKGEALAWDGSLQKLTAAFEKEGFQGLYRGYGANVLYKLPADLAKFLAFEALKSTGSLPTGPAGALATLWSNAVTTPLDVVRTQVMVEGAQKESKNVLQKLQDLIDTGDSNKIWSGFGWRLARGIVAGAIQFTVLEGTKEAVEGRR